MKDLTSPELARFKPKFPTISKNHLQMISPESKAYTFDFPADDEETILRCIVSTHKFSSDNGFNKITISAMNPSMLRAVTPNELYKVKDYIMESTEHMVWKFNPSYEKSRAKLYRAVTNSDFDMNNFVLHLQQADDDIPCSDDFRIAYEKKLQKNKGFTYGRGTIGDWKFIHILTKNPFPWLDLQAIAYREFKDCLTQVFINEETRVHPDHFVIWYNPNFQSMV